MTWFSIFIILGLLYHQASTRKRPGHGYGHGSRPGHGYGHGSRPGHGYGHGHGHGHGHGSRPGGSGYSRECHDCGRGRICDKRSGRCSKSMKCGSGYGTNCGPKYDLPRIVSAPNLFSASSSDITLSVHTVLTPALQCDDGYFGDDCVKICHCDGGRVCDKKSGACPHNVKCASGYSGDNCQNACKEGTFGPGCSNTCHCFEGASCDSMTGECPGGLCAPPWLDPTCQTDLPRIMSAPNLFSASSSDFTLTWHSWTGFVHPTLSLLYQIEYRVNKHHKVDDEWKTGPLVMDSIESIDKANVAGLLPNLLYDFRVIPILRLSNGGHVRGFVSPEGLSFRTKCAAPEPTNVTFVGALIDTTQSKPVPVISVVWKPLRQDQSNCENLKYYEILYQKSISESANWMSVGAKSTESAKHISKDVEFKTEYWVIVVAHNNEELHSRSVRHTVLTPALQCGDGYFGDDCVKICHCDGGRVCDKKSGACPHNVKCASGYSGSDCQNACREGTFGPSCLSTCHCSGGASCDPITGVCPGGLCAPTWLDPACQTGIPRIVSPPDLFRSSPSDIMLTWQSWSGYVHPSITLLYQIEYRLNEHHVRDDEWMAGPLLMNSIDFNERAQVGELSPNHFYDFRVIPILQLSNGTRVRGTPSPEGLSFRTRCTAPEVTNVTSVTAFIDTTRSNPVPVLHVEWQPLRREQSNCENLKYYEIIYQKSNLENINWMSTLAKSTESSKYISKDVEFNTKYWVIFVAHNNEELYSRSVRHTVLTPASPIDVDENVELPSLPIAVIAACVGGGLLIIIISIVIIVVVVALRNHRKRKIGVRRFITGRAVEGNRDGIEGLRNGISDNRNLNSQQDNREIENPCNVPDIVPRHPISKTTECQSQLYDDMYLEPVGLYESIDNNQYESLEGSERRDYVNCSITNNQPYTSLSIQ